MYFSSVLSSAQQVQRFTFSRSPSMVNENTGSRLQNEVRDIYTETDSDAIGLDASRRSSDLYSPELNLEAHRTAQEVNHLFLFYYFFYVFYFFFFFVISLFLFYLFLLSTERKFTKKKKIVSPFRYITAYRIHHLRLYYWRIIITSPTRSCPIRASPEPPK